MQNKILTFSGWFLFCLVGRVLAAPPNPYLFFESGKSVVFGGQGDSETTSHRIGDLDVEHFFMALKGCCFQRQMAVQQADGIEYVLAIKIDFQDQVGTRSGDQLDQYLFANQGISLKTYYREVSYGQMEIQAGPANGILPKGNKWIRANRLMSYYGDGKHNVSRYRELVREACRGIDTEIDFRQYDRDKNGIVDHLFVIHSGDDEASTFTGAFGPNIWSVLVPSVNGKFDGVAVDAAVLVAEEPSFKHPHLGIYFHEFFHDFGAPDVYGSPMIDARDHKWGLMGMYGPYQGDMVNGSGDGMNPSHIIGYLKWDFDARPESGRHGWLKTTKVEENVVNLLVPCIELNPTLFKVDILDRQKEFFLVENRNTGSGAIYDRKLPESGILIWHIDESKARSPYSIDAGQQIWLEDPNDPQHIGINPKDPHQRNLKFISDGAAYSTDDQQVAFMPSTQPNSHANDGTPSRISITNIGPEGKTVPLTVSFGDTYEPNNGFVQAFSLETGQIYQSFIFSANDVDYYRFRPDNDTIIVAQLTEIPAENSYHLSLFDQHQNLIAVSESMESAVGQQIVYQAEATEILYLVVRSRSGFSSEQSYQLILQQIEDQVGRLQISRARSFPNPVQSGQRVTLTYTIPDFQKADEVALKIYSVGGDLVHSDSRPTVVGSGRFSWSAKGISAGIYLYSIRAQRDGELHQVSGKIAVVSN